MSADNYAVVNIETGIIENMVVWDGASDWAPPPGYLAVLSNAGAAIGWSYIDGQFIQPQSEE